MKLFWLTVHHWGSSVCCTADFMDANWASATFLARLTYWSVTQAIRLNSRMTSSPSFVSVGILIVYPSGRLFHSLSSTIVSLVVPALCFLSSASVRGWCLACSVAEFSRVCTEQKLKTSGTSSSSSFHIVFRFFPPLMQINCHLEDVRRHNSAWMIRQHRWCASVCTSESVSHWCCMCPKVWVGSSSSVFESPFGYP